MKACRLVIERFREKQRRVDECEGSLILNKWSRDFPVVQWLALSLPGAWVRSLAGELRFHKLCDVVKKKKWRPTEKLYLSKDLKWVMD